MEYMSCPEAAKKWGISERRVQILCRENRIQGVSKLGYMWLIPKDAEKPIDGRTKQGRLTIRSQPQMCGKVKIMQTIQKRYGKADVRRTPN